MADRPTAAAGDGGTPTCAPRPIDCTVVVVTYNSERHIVPFLDSVPAAAGGLSVHVVVVDNCSTDGTADVVRGRPGVTLLKLGENLGYAAGINAGRRSAAPCGSILVANPDVTLGRGCIERLHRAVAGKGCGAAVPMMVDGRGSATWSLRREPTVGRQFGEALLGDRFPSRPAWASEIVRDPHAYRRGRTVDWAAGAVLMVSAACDAAVGDWDESFFLFSEEVDYSERIRRHGFAISYVPDAEAMHEEGGSRRGEDLLSLLVVNRLRYYRRRHGRLAAAGYAAALLVQLVLRSADRPHRRAALVLSRTAPSAVLWNRFPPAAELRPRRPLSLAPFSA